MRITYLHQYFNTPEMSGGTRSYEMARRLVAMGHEVNMVTSWREEGGERDWYETEEAGIRVHWLPVPYSNHMSYSERMRAFVRFAWQAARKAASIPADVVFATSTPLTIALPGAYAARKQKVPMVFEVRDLWPEVPIALGVLNNPIAQKAGRLLERFAYNKSAHVVALAPGMRDGVCNTGYDGNKVSVIPNGADLDSLEPAFEPQYKNNESYSERRAGLVVYCGTIGPANGVGYICRLAESIKRQFPEDETEFLVIGDGKCRKEVEMEAEKLGVLGSKVKFLGAVSKRQVFEWLQQSDVTIMTYDGPEVLYRDSVSNKFFDSIACGCPVVSNFEGFSTMTAKAYGAGIILPRQDLEGAAATLVDYLSDRVAMDRARVNAVGLATEWFSRDRLAVALETVLRGVVERRADQLPVGLEFVGLWDEVKGAS
ncbi:MAG: glycosyltransferase family 4 protein [Thioalkalivibrionaceae bacterium]